MRKEKRFRRRSRTLAGTCWILFCSQLWGEQPSVRVRIETDLGEILIELDAARAPVTTANFLRHVDGGLYDGGRFHRTVTMNNQPNNSVKIEVIQAGISPEKTADSIPPIPLERTSTTGLRHRNGSVSMARTTPDSARSDFFVCIGDQPSLDYGGERNPDGQGFAAFGRVVEGMQIVLKIHASSAEGQRLEPPLVIRRARRVE